MPRIHSYYRRMPAHPSKRRTPAQRKREAEYEATRPSLDSVIEDVYEGRRSGYTYTGGWFFDIDDPKSMERVYNRLGEHVLYVIGTTNQTLDEFMARGGRMDIGYNFGASVWRHANGTVYVDRVVIDTDITDAEARRIAQRNNQFVLLKVDGRTRSFAFIDAPGYVTAIHGQRKGRTFAPARMGS